MKHRGGEGEKGQKMLSMKLENEGAPRREGKKRQIIGQRGIELKADRRKERPKKGQEIKKQQRRGRREKSGGERKIHEKDQIS